MFIETNIVSDKFIFSFTEILTDPMHSVLRIWMKVYTRILEVPELIKIPYDLEQDTLIIHNMSVIV